jgi:hypothetical protein
MVTNRINKVVLFTLLTGLFGSATGRLLEKDWSFQEMFDKSELIVIAEPVSTKETHEHRVLPDVSPPTRVVGLSTEFEARLVLKGSKEIRTFVLHHYRPEQEETSINEPALVTFKGKQHTPFLLFLIKEPDGRYAPVTGQTDPGLFSVIELQSMAQ